MELMKWTEEVTVLADHNGNPVRSHKDWIHHAVSCDRGDPVGGSALCGESFPPGFNPQYNLKHFFEAKAINCEGCRAKMPGNGN